jgi:biopolymer transport protein ExbD
MSRFRRQATREVPGLNLASLPDLIFTVLFFFMIVTHMRQVTPRVHYEVPQGTELQKDVRKTGLVYLFIGRPVDGQGRVLSDEPRIQLNDRYVTVDQIGPEIARLRNSLPAEERHLLTVSLRVDRDTEMGLVSDVKQALRHAGALHINYSATRRTSRESSI